MVVSYENNRFVCKCSFAEKDSVKRIGFTWDFPDKVWCTSQEWIALKLREYFDTSAKNKLAEKEIKISPWCGAIHFDEKTNTPYPYQLTAAKWALSRNKGYISLSAGMGKTIVAALIINSLCKEKKPSEFPPKFLYICPPHLVMDARAKLERWVLTHQPISTMKNLGSDILIIPDSMTCKEETLEVIKNHVRLNPERVVFYDEAQRIKNDMALRSKAFYKKIMPLFTRVYPMSGTPLPSRNMELFAMLHYVAPECIDFKNKHQYGIKYCAGFEGTWGWDYSGSSNSQELALKVKDRFMLRMRKEDYLKELPEKTEELVFIGENVPAKIALMDKKILAACSPKDLTRSVISLKVKGQEDNELSISTYRKELGILKLKPALEHIKYLLEENEDSFIIFAIHKEVIAGLAKALADYKPVIVVGETPMNERLARVQNFQARKTRVIIGNIQAMGTGFDMTAASRVLFVESSWVPSDNEQASDRAHRIGQKQNVLITHLVFKNSLDRAVLETILKKKEITKHI